jgi:4-hydroxyphenylpyruvate dioxygenase-like putative hemolysin
MTAPSEPPSVSDVAMGIADAERVGASAKATVANPTNNSRFIEVSSLDRVIAVIGNTLNPSEFHTTAKSHSYRPFRSKCRVRI